MEKMGGLYGFAITSEPFRYGPFREAFSLGACTTMDEVGLDGSFYGVLWPLLREMNHHIFHDTMASLFGPIEAQLCGGCSQLGLVPRNLK